MILACIVEDGGDGFETDLCIYVSVDGERPPFGERCKCVDRFQPINPLYQGIRLHKEYPCDRGVLGRLSVNQED
jgi:hypothetical protein